MRAETEILNLLYRYSELIDSGDLEGAAGLFAHARVRRIRGESEIFLDSAQLLAMWRDVIRIHPDGTPRTKHVVTNAILEIDEEAGAATSRSYYTVLQQTDEVPLQPVAAGRYHDRFERVDGRWRFAFRDYSMLDMVGDVHDHVSRYGRNS